VHRYNWHSGGSLGWTLPKLKYKYIFQIKYTEATLLNSTRKLLWFEITKMLTGLKNTFIVWSIIIFHIISFHVANVHTVGVEKMLRVPGDYTSTRHVFC